MRLVRDLVRALKYDPGGISKMYALTLRTNIETEAGIYVQA
jgi:hypothetical protein